MNRFRKSSPGKSLSKGAAYSVGSQENRAGLSFPPPQVASSMVIQPVVKPAGGAGVIQRNIIVHSQNHVESANRAFYVKAEVSGQTLGPGANSPTVDPVGWTSLANEYVMDDIFRMHLWNGRLGGPGNQTWNLAPGDRDANQAMAQQEVLMQGHVNNGRRVELTTNVTYGHNTTPEKYFPTQMQLVWVARNSVNNVVVAQGNWHDQFALPERPDDSYSSMDESTASIDREFEYGSDDSIDDDLN